MNKVVAMYSELEFFKIHCVLNSFLFYEISFYIILYYHYFWPNILSMISLQSQWFFVSFFTMFFVCVFVQRLSKFASQQLTAGNPNIADLSDKHRPTKIGEFYSELYDNEWSEAFEVIKPLVYPHATEDPDTEYFEEVLRILKNILMVKKISCVMLCIWFCVVVFFSYLIQSFTKNVHFRFT